MTYRSIALLMLYLMGINLNVIKLIMDLKMAKNKVK
jgi:hypothetical protein